MSCPCDVTKVVASFRKATNELTSEQILLVAGGSDSAWGKYLRGPRVQAVVKAANVELCKENREIISYKPNSGRWRMVSCAEARVISANQQASKAGNHLRNAEGNMWAVAQDERSPKQLRQDAIAWLQLFVDDKNAKYLMTFEEWAEELVKKLPHHKAA